MDFVRVHVEFHAVHHMARAIPISCRGLERNGSICVTEKGDPMGQIYTNLGRAAADGTSGPSKKMSKQPAGSTPAWPGRCTVVARPIRVWRRADLLTPVRTHRSVSTHGRVVLLDRSAGGCVHMHRSGTRTPPTPGPRAASAADD